MANPAVNYALDESGRLRELDDRYDPNSVPKQLLGALQQTGETSSAILSQSASSTGTVTKAPAAKSPRKRTSGFSVGSR